MQIEQVKGQIIATRSARVRLFPGRRISDKAVPLFCSDYYQEWQEAGTEEKARVSAELLEQFILGVAPGWYMVSMQKGENAVRTRLNVPLQVGESHSISGMVQPNYPVKSEEQIRSEVMEQLEREREIDDLRDMINGLQESLKEKNGFEDKVLSIFKLMGFQALENNGVPAREISNTISGQASVMNAAQSQEEEGEPDEGEQRFTAAINGIASKLQGRTPEFMEKLNRLSPERIQKLCDLPDDQIDLLTSAL